MSNAQGLQKYWITACDEQRRVIFNKIITTGSVTEAQMIAESHVPAEHHGSICITDESDNPVVDDAAGLPTFHAMATLVRGYKSRDRNAHVVELTEHLPVSKQQAEMTLAAFDRLEHQDRRQLAEQRAAVERNARNIL